MRFALVTIETKTSAVAGGQFAPFVSIVALPLAYDGSRQSAKSPGDIGRDTQSKFRTPPFSCRMKNVMVMID